MANLHAALAKELNLRNIRPSHQRIMLLAYLRQNDTHPTVDEIYRALKPEITTLSKSTVYNTLEIFYLNKIVRTVTIEESEVRYDAVAQSHGHFKCAACGTIEDFTVDLDLIEPDQLREHQVQQKDVYYHGFCAACLTGKVRGTKA